jgi:hypothetical protein
MSDVFLADDAVTIARHLRELEAEHRANRERTAPIVHTADVPPPPPPPRAAPVGTFGPGMRGA